MLLLTAAPMSFLPCLWFNFVHTKGVASKTGDAYPYGAPGLTSVLMEVRVLSLNHTFCLLSLFGLLLH